MPLTLDKIKALIRLANNNPNDHEANLAARKVCQQLTDSDIENLGYTKTAAGKLNEVIFKEYTDPRTDELVIRISRIVLHNDQHSKIVILLKELKKEIERPRTYNDVNRSTETTWKPNPPPPPPNPTNEYSGVDWDAVFGSGFSDFFKGFRNSRDPFGGFKPSDSQKKYWTDSAPHVDAPEPGFDADDFVGKRVYVNYKPFTDPPKPPGRNKEEDAEFIKKKRKRRQELRVCSKCGLETMTFRTDEVPWICNPCHWKDKL